MANNMVKFNRKDKPEFYKVLKTRVNQHFTENNISRHANGRMVFKTIFMLALYFLPLIFMLTGVVTSLWPIMLMWLTMGLGMSGIGLSVMHDANHGSYSETPWINDTLGKVLYFIGGYHVNWKIQHNVLHHSFTNIHGHDEDIEKGIIRFSPDQERKPFFKYQAFYAPLLYSIMTFYWWIGKDFQQLFRYRKKDLLKGQGKTFFGALIEILMTKAFYTFITLILPIMVLPIAGWQTFLGFVMMQLMCGLILALIFQPAHVIAETHFYAPDENGSVENNWAIHQMHTTSNFANGSRLFSWFIGGLNYQIEHHLFPNICHVHYKALSKIVKQTAAEFDVPYYHHETFFGALKSHFSFLHSLGTGAYDRRLQGA